MPAAGRLGLRRPGHLHRQRRRRGGAARHPGRRRGHRRALRALRRGQEQPAQRPLSRAGAAGGGGVGPAPARPPHHPPRGTLPPRRSRRRGWPGRSGTAGRHPGLQPADLPPDPAALAALFPDLRRRLAAAPCRFRNCRHQGDPGCAAGSDWDRFTLYGHCLREVEAAAGLARGRGRPAAGDLRQRGDRLEPLLDPRLRRTSRRRSRQLEAAEEAPAAELSPPDPAG